MRKAALALGLLAVSCVSPDPVVVVEEKPDTVPGDLVMMRGADRDRAALEELYMATGGDDWRRNDNWLTDAPLDDWYGVHFGMYNADYGRVTGLYLGENNLRGDIPPGIARLDSLYALNLYHNRLTGPIPPEIGNMRSLSTLALYGNRLRGRIPKELGRLRQMRYLALDQNRLSGAIPPELGDLSRLLVLELYRNRLTGGIPPELGRLSRLGDLKLQRNRLTGRVPEELSELARHLKILRIDRNRLEGPLPDALTALDRLMRFHFHRQDLCAPDTEEFRYWIEGIKDARGPFCEEES